MISHDYRYIFVHIQKTGGTSLRAALCGGTRDSQKHYTAKELQTLYGRELWDAYYKFAFVRNPWDRLVGWWSAIDAQRARIEGGVIKNDFRAHVLRRARTFEEFLKEGDYEFTTGDGRNRNIFRNQIDYLTDDTGRISMDFIGRFEQLRKDVSTVFRTVGVCEPKVLPHRTKSNHGPYTDYYTPHLARLVGERFARDIDAFGYRYGD